MKMVRSSITVLMICIILPLSFHTSSAQGFLWAHSIISGVGVSSNVDAVVTDAANNGYFVGNFTGTTDFDPSLGVQSLTSVADPDMYILKKDAAGNFLWVKQIAGITSGSANCFGRDIGVDALGNIYVGGSFRDSFDFDPGPGVHKLTSYGGTHSFVLKLDPLGNFIWVRDMGNHTTVAAMLLSCMKMDAAANIYFGCSTGGTAIPATIDVDPGPGIYNILCPGATSNDILIEKLDSAGNFVWVKQISGTDFKGPQGLAVDTQCNVYVTGLFKGTADFDPGPGISNLTATNDFDAFVAKYDSAGNFQWADAISGDGEQLGADIATDTYGNLVVTGHFDMGTTDFDPGAGVYDMTATSLDMFVLKLRNDGSFAWANSVQPAANDRGQAIATDQQGNVYTSGDFFANADFDPGPDQYWLSGEVYVQKLDSAGNFLWARAFGDGYPKCITTDHAGDIYVVGGFSVTSDFDPGPGMFTLSGGNGGFIEKLCGTSLAISANDSTLCVGDQAQLTTPAITGATYTWTKNDTVITGSGNSITISTPGAYEVYVTGGCPNASAVLYVHDCTGVGETTIATGVQAYPNPFDDAIAVKGLEAGDHVCLLDITGRTLHTWQSATSTVTFTTTDISPGYYMLRITNEHGAVKGNLPVVKN